MKVTTDRNMIVEWTERHGGSPQLIDYQYSGSDTPGIRIDFSRHIDDLFLPERRVQKASWDEFFDIFKRQKLAFVYTPDVDLNDPISISQAYRFVPIESVQGKNMQERDQMLEDFMELMTDFPRIRSD